MDNARVVVDAGGGTGALAELVLRLPPDVAVVGLEAARRAPAHAAAG